MEVKPKIKIMRETTQERTGRLTKISVNLDFKLGPRLVDNGDGTRILQLHLAIDHNVVAGV